MSEQDHTDFDTLVDEQLGALGDMLKSKNRAYGNSALDPVRVFSRADTAEQLRVRIDDKLSRLARGAAAGEDVIFDLLGYLVLLRIAERPTPKVTAWPDLPPVTGMTPPRPIRQGDKVKILKHRGLPQLEGTIGSICALMGNDPRFGIEGRGWATEVEPVPEWVLPFVERPGHYARAEGRTVGPADTAGEAAVLLATALDWGAERHAFLEYEVRT